MYKISPPLPDDDAGLPQHFQMLGYGGFGKLQLAGQRAYATAMFEQQPDDFQARPVRKRFEKNQMIHFARSFN